MKRMKKVTNRLCNWAIKLPAWALCTVMVVLITATLMASLLGGLFILVGVVEKVIVVSDCIIGVILTIFGLFFLYFTLSIIDAFFDRVLQTEIENNKKHKDSDNEDN